MYLTYFLFIIFIFGWFNYDNEAQVTISRINVRTRKWDGQDGLVFIFSHTPR